MLLPLFGALKLADRPPARVARTIRRAGSALVAMGGAYFLWRAPTESV